MFKGLMVLKLEDYKHLDDKIGHFGEDMFV
jgi:hypothetical protein